MKKNTLVEIIIALVGLIAFNIVAFCVPHLPTLSFWIGYGFCLLAFVLEIIFSALAFGNNKKTSFMGLSVIQLTSIYLILQVIFSFVCMFVPVIPGWVALIVSAVLTAFFVIQILSVFITRNIVGGIDEKVKNQTIFIRFLSVELETMAAKSTDQAISAELSKIKEAVRYSDPMSNPALQDVESRISEQCRILEYAVTSNQLEQVKMICNQIGLLLTERNQKCKLLK